MAQTNTFNTRIQNKHDIEANWIEAINFIPLKAEIIVYDVDDTHNYARFKIGDGLHTINELPFAITDISDSIDEDKTYVHSQKIASDTWYVKHNLNKFPSVSVVDSANTLVGCDRDYINENELVVRSKAPFSGTCYCN